MREIKFRAWNKTEKVMVYSDEDKSASWWDGVRSSDVEIINNCLGNEDYEYMQYTGLKDKNRKEIYEGDICEAWSQGTKGIGEIKRRIDGLWIFYPAWQLNEFWGLMPSANGGTDVEIIGNIYDNPELMEGDNGRS